MTNIFKDKIIKYLEEEIKAEEEAAMPYESLIKNTTDMREVANNNLELVKIKERILANKRVIRMVKIIAELTDN